MARKPSVVEGKDLLKRRKKRFKRDLASQAPRKSRRDLLMEKFNRGGLKALTPAEKKALKQMRFKDKDKDEETIQKILDSPKPVISKPRSALGGGAKGG